MNAAEAMMLYGVEDERAKALRERDEARALLRLVVCAWDQDRDVHALRCGSALVGVVASVRALVKDW